MPPHPSESPAKKQSKWSAEEDALIIDLRGSGMKWEDISKRLPGRSAISCRLHYQNYLERRSEWDEERKNKLARLYERFKPEMWSKVAEEMAVPWRAAEAMHWQLGEAEMARRAGVVPFSLSNVALDAPPSHPQSLHSPSRGHAHSQSHPAVLSMGASAPAVAAAAAAMTPVGRYPPRSVPAPPPHHNTPIPAPRPYATRRDSIGPPPPPRSVYSPSDLHLGLPEIRSPTIGVGRGSTASGALPTMLPSVAEMTTGISPFSAPAYSVSSSPGGMYASPAPSLPPLGYPGPPQQQMLPTTRPMTAGPSMEGKRRRSPEYGGREATRRRQDL